MRRAGPARATASLGHSDADAPLHALTDALLGTIGAGDIGQHFPPSDPRWRDADCALFLRHAVAAPGSPRRPDRERRPDDRLRAARGSGRIARRWQERLAEVLGLPPDRVSIKATTSERLGFTGRGEGIAAQAVVSVAFGGLTDGPVPGTASRPGPRLLAACEAAGLRLVTAESCTGGLIAGCLTEIAGSSAVVDRGYVVYDNRAKAEMLGVPAELLRQHGAVSEAVAREMAEGALARTGCELAVAVTGIAGPGGATAGKAGRPGPHRRRADARHAYRCTERRSSQATGRRSAAPQSRPRYGLGSALL